MMHKMQRKVFGRSLMSIMFHRADNRSPDAKLIDEGSSLVCERVVLG